MRGPERSREPEPIGTVLEGLLRGRTWGAGMMLGRLGRRWPEVVGDRLAEECAPVRLDGGVLVVRARSAAWAAQLQFLAAQVQERANAVLGGRPIREVRVSVGDVEGHPGRRRDRPAKTS